MAQAPALLDARLAQRPRVFDGGKIEEFNDWSFIVKNYACLVLSPDIGDLMERAAQKDVEITHQ